MKCYISFGFNNLNYKRATTCVRLMTPDISQGLEKLLILLTHVNANVQLGQRFQGRK